MGYWADRWKQQQQVDTEIEIVDPLSATQSDYLFERAANLTGEEEDYKLLTLNDSSIMPVVNYPA